MLEHMAFKGTHRRSARGIAEAIENVGGQLNAYTSREQTAYYARVLADDVPLAVDLLADILQHSVFDEEELARERGVVVQEIGQVNDTPDDLVFDQFQETAFPGQALGRSILGPPEVVAAMPRTTLVDYMARHYGPKRMVLAAAGKIEHDARGRSRRAAVSRAAGGRRRPGRARRVPRRRAARGARSRAGASAARPAGVRLHRRRLLCAAGALGDARRRHVVAPVPGGAREPRPRLLDLLLRVLLSRHRASSGSMPAPASRRRPSSSR